MAQTRPRSRQVVLGGMALSGAAGVFLAAHAAAGGPLATVGAARGPAARPPVVAGPIAVAPGDAYSGTVTSGESANALYAFLAGRTAHVVHLGLTIPAPVSVARSQALAVLVLNSKCTAASITPTCLDNLNPAGLKMLITGAGLSITVSAGSYTVVGDAVVSPVTRDASGYYNVPLRGVRVSSGANDGGRH